ncbi:hypothetical protein ABK040_009412 [Willaertia magna]
MDKRQHVNMSETGSDTTLKKEDNERTTIVNNFKLPEKRRASIGSYKPCINEFNIFNKTFNYEFNELSNDENEFLNEIKSCTFIKCFSFKEIEIIEKLATGGFSNVYKIKILDKIYAGKRMLSNRTSLIKNINKFKRELLLMKRFIELNCNGITKLEGYCFEKESNEYWIILEFMNLGDLYGILHCNHLINDNYLIIDKIRNDLNIKLNIAKKIAFCLMEIHENTKYAHLDIKSLNILLNTNLDVKLSDFCDAKKAILDSNPFETHGTIYWMAPECMKKEQFCLKSDIYGLAIIFYELLTLEKPYKGLNVLEVKELMEKNEIEPFRMKFDHLKEKNSITLEFIKLIEWMWKEDPNQRPNAREVVNELNEIILKL